MQPAISADSPHSKATELLMAQVGSRTSTAIVGISHFVFCLSGGTTDFVSTKVQRSRLSALAAAPFTAADLLGAEWDRPYTREEAAFPAGRGQAASKYWPPVGRVDNAFGDKNLMCSCPPIEDFAE